jgi:hypothetical protein
MNEHHHHHPHRHRRRRPVECVYCPTTQHFRVLQSRGKTLHNGGYGYMIRTTAKMESSSSVSSLPCGSNAGTFTTVPPTTTPPTAPTPTSTHHYLFLEEVLYLHERGLLHAYRDDYNHHWNNNDSNNDDDNNIDNDDSCNNDDDSCNNDNHNNDDNHTNDDNTINGTIPTIATTTIVQLPPLGTTNHHQNTKKNHHTTTTTSTSFLPLSRSELYRMLSSSSSSSSTTTTTTTTTGSSHVSMATYFVYQYLRTQTYRVVRHTPTRIGILLQQQQQQHVISLSVEQKKKKEQLPCDVPDTTAASLPKDDDADGSNDNNDDDDNNTTTVRVNATTMESYRKWNHPSTTTNACSSLPALKRKLRYDTSTAAPPTTYPYHHHDTNPVATTTTTTTTITPSSSSSSSLSSHPPRIAFDCYHPTSSFSAATPGIPDFYVAVTYMSTTPPPHHRHASPAGVTPDTLSFQQIQYLLQQTMVEIPQPITTTTTTIHNDSNRILNHNDKTHPNTLSNETTSLRNSSDEHHSTTDTWTTMPITVPTPRRHIIPLKIATVSDSGTVIMFGITNRGVPTNPYVSSQMKKMNPPPQLPHSTTTTMATTK